ncbi:MAG: hypothetical protein A4E48_02436 [Methanosaeta sp. PtaU1.Bin060]|nr:MAG: hypothetical protein A4E48_02436 [Methanosaeta sp. PtaU1.Bin060]
MNMSLTELVAAVLASFVLIGLVLFCITLGVS